MTTQQSNTKLIMPIKDTIILDNKKCNAELLTIYSDGRITVAEHLKPTETAAKVLQIVREQWMDDAQARKIREQEERIKLLEAVTNDPHALWANWLRGSVALPAGIGDVRQYQDRIKRLEEAGDAMLNAWLMPEDSMEYCDWVALSADAKAMWHKAKEAKP